VDGADAGTKGHGTIENFARNRFGRSMAGVIGILCANPHACACENDENYAATDKVATQIWNPSLIKLP
jgi:hypothetical protein